MGGPRRGRQPAVRASFKRFEDNPHDAHVEDDAAPEAGRHTDG
ncbi:hypothetical protein [Nocardioides marmoraquaticus]